MTSVAFVDLSPEVLSTAPTCPTPTVIRALRNAARELCEKAECYRFELENDAAIANQSEAELSLPDDTILQRIVTLTLNGERLSPTSPTLLDADFPGWRTESGVPGKFYRSTVDLASVRLYPTPASSYSTVGLNGEVIIKPTRTATGIEDFFLERYQDVLIDGALSRLLKIKGADWYDPGLAAHHEALFNLALDGARQFANSDDTQKETTVRYGGL